MITPFKDLKGIKQEDIDGPILKRFYRRVAVAVATKLAVTSITPSQIAVIKFLLILVTAVLFTMQSYIYLLFGAITLQISLVLDQVDGSLARIKGIASDYGYWLDKVVDEFSRVILFFAIAYGVYINTASSWPWIFGFLGITSYIMLSLMYVIFRSKFKFGTSEIESLKGKHKFIKQLFFVEPFITVVMTCTALINNLYLFLIFAGIVGPICALSYFVMITLKIRKRANETIISDAMQDTFQ